MHVVHVAASSGTTTPGATVENRARYYPTGVSRQDLERYRERSHSSNGLLRASIGVVTVQAVRCYALVVGP